MKRFWILIFLVFQQYNLFSQTTWELLNPTPSYQSGVDIKFVSPTHGYILTSKELLETTDFGVNWIVKQTIPSGVDMQFKDDVGFIVGNNGYVIKTTDAGTSWTSVNTGYNFSFTSVSIVDANTIFISANFQHLLKSTDGGITWTAQLFPTWSVNSTVFLSDTVGHATTADGKIYKTIDGGLNWYLTHTTNLSPSVFHTIYFVDDTVGFATNDYNRILKTTDGGENWTEIPGVGSFQTIYAIYFLDLNNGYAAGEHGAIYKTSDGGSTWSPAYFQVGFVGGTTVFGIYFRDLNTGFAIGMRGRILKTTNAGTSWSQYSPTYNDVKQLGFVNATTGFALVDNTFFKTTDEGHTWINIGVPETNAQTVCFDFVNQTTAYALGGGEISTSAGVHKIYKTTDSGNSWATVSAVSPTFNDDLFCIAFIDQNTGFASGGFNQPSTWKTVNGGASWTQVNSLRFGKMQFLNAQVGYASLKYSYDRIYKTVDGGLNWTVCFLPSSGYINSFYFVDANIGYVVGDSAFMYKTIDGGQIWQQLNPPYGHYENVKFYSGTVGYASDTSMNNFYKTDDGGVTWQSLLNFGYASSIEFNNGYIYLAGNIGKIVRSYTGYGLGTEVNPGHKSTVKIYPNPCSNEINIVGSDTNKINEIFIFDISGKLLMKTQSPYSNEIKMSVSHLADGIYFVKTRFEDKSQTTTKLIVSQ